MNRAAGQAKRAALDVVRLAVRESSEERDAALAAAVGADPDWDSVLRTATNHGVAPLLAAAVRGAAWGESVPVLVRRHLRLLTAAASIESASAARALAALLGALEQREVRALVLKGPALAHTLYTSPALRPYSDFDLLCRPDDRVAAADALRWLGYERRAPKAADPEDFHHVYLSQSGGLPVELHSDLLQLGLPARCGDELWSAPETFALGGTSALMLAPHHQILHLAVHLHTHGYGRLIWFKDLDLLIRQRQRDIEWDVVHALARVEGAELSVQHALAYLRALLDTPLPDEALAVRSGNRVGELAHAILWPRRHVLRLESKQRLRSVRFNPREGALGVVPSLLVMGRRRDKLARLLGGRAAAM